MSSENFVMHGVSVKDYIMYEYFIDELAIY